MSKINIYENILDEEEDIEEIDEEEVIEETEEEDIDDGNDDLDDLLGDLEDYEEEVIEDKDDLLDDLDDLINDYEEEEEEEQVEEQIAEKRTTFNILTKYEKNFILGFRTQQIINGSVILIDINTLKDKSAYSIAQEELRLKRIPFKLKRTLPNGKIELWDISELIIL